MDGGKNYKVTQEDLIEKAFIISMTHILMTAMNTPLFYHFSV